MKRLRVYLSSTYEDLKAYREAVFAALEKGGLEIARMEAYTAADERPLDLCLRDVAQSDVYVGLYAWRYGYEPPAQHGNPDGKSITELEYGQADSAGLRKLLFFTHPDTFAGWPDQFKDEVTGAGERGEKLNRLRKQLGTEKTGSFFRTPDELATLVLAAIMRTGLSGRVYNIPPLPLGFVPRPNLSTAIVDSLVGGNAGAAGGNTLVQGAGGFGKTTLAIAVCHHPQVVNAFPDGMLWTSLGATPNLAIALSDLFVVVMGSGPAVAGFEQIALAVAKVLDGRRCLIVVDDVWRSDDLAPFLRLNGPRLLVTTRVRTLVEQAGQTDWSEVPVDEMEAGEAASILRRGLEPDASSVGLLERMAERLGCWPLLLELANARLLEERKLRRTTLSECIHTVTGIFERKGVLGFDRRDSQARNTAVARSIEVGLDVADEWFPGLARKATELSVFPENVAIPATVVADLWGMDTSDVEEDVLRPLDNLSLLHWDREAGIFRLHMMVDRALDARLEQDAVGASAVHRRLLDAWGDPHKLPYDYAWRWFGWHCAHAKEAPRLHQLLLDLDWLRAKLAATDINALIREFDYAEGAHQAALLQGTLRLCAHVLAKDKAQLPTQLLARVNESAGPLRERLLTEALTIRQPWLRPLRPTLTPPGGPLLRTLAGHTDPVTDVALTPDGTRAVSASEDCTLQVWDLARGEVLRTLRGHRRSVTAVAVTPDGTRAVSGGRNGVLKVWDLERGEALHTLEGHTGEITAMSITPDGTRAVSASEDKTLRVWDLARGDALRTLEGHSGYVTAVAITADGTCAVSASDDMTVRVWDLERGETLRSVAAGFQERVLFGMTTINHPVKALALAPDPERMLLAAGPTLRMFDLARMEGLLTLEGNTARVTAVAVSPDGTQAVAGCGDGTLEVWDVTRGEMLRTLAGHADAVTAVTITPDGERVVSASRDHTLKVWDLEGTATARAFEGHTRTVTAVAVTSDGKRAVSASYDQTLKVWDVERAEVLRTVGGPSAPDGELWDTGMGGLGRVGALALTPDGTRMVSASDASAGMVWDLESGRLMVRLDGELSSLKTMTVTPDGTRVVSASHGNTIAVWDLARGEVVWTFEGHTGAITAIAVSADGTRMASASEDGRVGVWDLARGGARTFEGHTGPVTDVVFTGDGRRVVSASADSTLRVWSLESGATLSTLRGHSYRVTMVAVTPDGTRAVSASWDDTPRLWDLQRGEVLFTLKGQTGRVSALTVTPDGTCAVLASENWTVAVWHLGTGELVACFDAEAPITAVATTPDGRTLVAGDEKGRVHFLRLENAAPGGAR